MTDQPPSTQPPEQIAAWTAELLRGEVERTADGFLISLPGMENRRLQLASARVFEINTLLGQKKQEGETVLWDPCTYEVLVREETRFGPGLLPLDKGPVRKEDPDTGVAYVVGLPSDEYLLFLLGQIGGAGALRALRIPVGSFRIKRILEGQEGNLDAVKFLKQLLPRLLTVRVEVTKARPLTDLAQLSAAFLFQLTYNTDIPLVETRSWDDLLRISRIARSRRSRISEIEPPRRFYLPDLIYHYQMGVAADSPVLAFLSYYHIAEHFFEQVFNDDLIASVKDRLTQPGFSYRRKKDIEGMIREITRRLRIRGESTVFSEQEALRLTLQRFVKREDLLARLNSYDETLIDHYAVNSVAFCGGDPVDLRTQDEAKPFDLMAKRIYKTRNAVVHSKEGDRTRYVPFEDDRVLSREVPLARFVAEDIIIGSATPLQ
jgi:hypothetical protein